MYDPILRPRLIKADRLFDSLIRREGIIRYAKDYLLGGFVKILSKPLLDLYEVSLLPDLDDGVRFPRQFAKPCFYGPSAITSLAVK